MIVPELCSGCDKCLPGVPGRLHLPRSRLDAGARRLVDELPLSTLDPLQVVVRRRGTMPDAAGSPAPTSSTSRSSPGSRSPTTRSSAHRRARRDPRPRGAGLGARHRRRAADRAPAAARERAPRRRGAARASTATRCSPQAPAAEDGRFRVPAHPRVKRRERHGVEIAADVRAGRAAARRRARGASRARSTRARPRSTRSTSCSPTTRAPRPTRSTRQSRGRRSRARWPACRSR